MHQRQNGKNESYSSFISHETTRHLIRFVLLYTISTTVWDTKRAAAASRELDLLESIVPHDRKETALKLFHENNYQVNGTNMNFVRVFIVIIYVLYH